MGDIAWQAGKAYREIIYETIDGIDASRKRFDECLHGYFLSTRLTRKGSVPIGSASLRSGGFAICTR